MTDSAPLGSDAQLRRVLVVDDDPDMRQAMTEHLDLLARSLGLHFEIEQAGGTEAALQTLALRQFHLISCDMMMPISSGRLSVSSGIDVARAMTTWLAPTTKLCIYSAYFDPNADQFPELTSELPRIDRYVKTGDDAEGATSRTEALTPLQWAQRVVAYLEPAALQFTPTGRDRARATATGYWLEHAPRHLPTLLARHATDLDNSWRYLQEPARQVDAGLRFAESCVRLALAQTVMLLRAEGQLSDFALPHDETLATGLEQLSELEAKYRPALRAWSWHWYLTRALKPLDAVRLFRKETQHTLAPAGMRDTWSRLLPHLLVLMDFSAYWVQHPLWIDIRPGTDGLTGERIAANQWPRQRRTLPPPLTQVQLASGHGGVWQSAVRVTDPKPAQFAVLPWGEMLQFDADRRGCWLRISEHSSRGKREQVWLDIDGGGLMSRPVR